jgi:hypothetical protein
VGARLSVSPALGLFAGLAILYAPFASAWVETRVTTSPDASSHPDVTFDLDGGLHVLWEESGDIRHLRHDGLGWEAMVTVGDGSGFDRYTCWT